ncbi:glycine cleavage system aminomethyltransferase GcvT [Intestinimonas massiliensis (ex Afouda et al. 2020)]|uniref:glycine cleavage system aminomethyltransferase GcvT n=1 Tax=Intestinimonas massiliensis (ex Afouda et al. 2020) TaxID=1673721 RepID=UPI00067F210B|nr:glycine cleavage system aminomethyltransferase GcvT [Intestinimonas massiliensis (ex Afouda et al. 2020)]
MEQKTPLYAKHAAAGGKIVPFAGYLLPVQYPTGVIAEHMAVRTAAGLFDVSHMGELVFTGPDALRNLNHLLTNDFTGMYDGQVRYSPMCNDQGGCVDDLIVYKVHDAAYLVVVNAANKDKDAGWMREHLFGACEMEDISGRVAQVALQGPKSKQILLRLLDESVLPPKYYSFVRDVDLRGIRCLISRTGYTGEFGYELYCVSADAEGLWDLLLEAGADLGLIPCGLGARDTLRLEAAMPLYGHELNDVITPLEAGLDFAVKMGKEDFIGKDALAARLPVRQTRVGLEITGRGIAREHQDIYIGDRLAGQTTSGTHCPFLGKAVAMAYLSSADAVPGTRVEVDVRGRRVAAQVVELPFYKR